MFCCIWYHSLLHWCICQTCNISMIQFQVEGLLFRLKIFFLQFRANLSNLSDLFITLYHETYFYEESFAWKGLEICWTFFIITVSGVIMHDLSFIFWLFSFEQFQVAVITTIISVGGLCVLWYYIDSEFYLQYLRPQVFSFNLFLGGLILFI